MPPTVRPVPTTWDALLPILEANSNKETVKPLLTNYRTLLDNCNKGLKTDLNKVKTALNTFKIEQLQKLKNLFRQLENNRMPLPIEKSAELFIENETIRIDSIITEIDRPKPHQQFINLNAFIRNNLVNFIQDDPNQDSIGATETNLYNNIVNKTQLTELIEQLETLLETNKKIEHYGGNRNSETFQIVEIGRRAQMNMVIRTLKNLIAPHDIFQANKIIAAAQKRLEQNLQLIDKAPEIGRAHV